ncbi:MAG: FMN-binding protein [Sphaerochaetaceae bacterium]|nr:FMN-binding protein [Sphaerochaetaceae bacterium]
MATKKATQLILLIATVIVFAGILVALNTVTGPKILANQNSAVFEPLFAVMPEAKGFTALDLAAADTVKAAWKETSGKGYVIQLATNKGYTHEDIDITVAIAADGKISAVNLESYPETKDFGKETYPATYIGQDSTLANVQLVAGVTFSSKAFKGAIEDAFALLIDNGLIGAGVKEASQVITEMIPVVNADMCSETGMLQAKEVEVKGAKKAWASDSGKSVAFWLENGGDFLAIVDNTGKVTAYDLDGNDVTFAKNPVVTLAEAAYDEYQSVLNAKDIEEIMSLIPGAVGFRKLAVEAPDTVKSVWAETSGLGYVVRSATNKGFTHEYINLSVAFTADGKISNVVLESYPETRDFGADYPATYIGQDSTLSGVQIIAGVTYSSTAFKGAVNDAFTVLTSNGLVVEAVKEPSQVIDEMIPEKATALINPQGIFQGEEIEVKADGVVKAWRNPAKSVAAYWMNNADGDFLVLANAYGCATVYDLKGNDVTGSQKALSDAALANSTSVLAKATSKEIAKVTKLLPAGSTAVEVACDIYTSVADIVKAETADGVYYGFLCHTYGFGNHEMTYYVAIDPNGKISGLNTSTLIIEAEYYPQASVKKADYVAALTGVTADWTGEEALIANATLTTQSTQTALNEAFAAFELLTGGAN